MANKYRVILLTHRQQAAQKNYSSPITAKHFFAWIKKMVKRLWDFKMGKKVDYPWRFDYYYSSPVLYGDKLIIGSDDGYLYNINQRDGKLNWKFKSKGLDKKYRRSLE